MWHLFSALVASIVLTGGCVTITPPAPLPLYVTCINSESMSGGIVCEVTDRFDDAFGDVAE